MKKLSLFLLSLVFVLTLSISVCAEQNEVTMTDEDVIKTVGDKKLMEGTGNGFEPGKTLTRAEITTIVVRFKKLDNESVIDVDFDDVDKKDWFYDYVAIAYHEGIVKGVGNNKFAPNDEVTIGEAVTMILRALSDTTEVENAGNWPDNYMKFAKDLEIMGGIKRKANEKSLRIDSARIFANIYTSGKWSEDEEEKKSEVPVAHAHSGVILEVAEGPDDTNIVTLAMHGGVKEYITDNSELRAGTVLPGTVISFWLTEDTMWDIEAETVTKVRLDQNVIKIIDMSDTLIKCLVKEDLKDKDEIKKSDFTYLDRGSLLFFKSENCKLDELTGEFDEDGNQLYTRLYDGLEFGEEKDIEFVDDYSGMKYDDVDGTEVFYQLVKDKDEEYVGYLIYTEED